MKVRVLAMLCPLAACAGIADDDPDSRITQITLERTRCYGRCPVYKLTINRDGTVVYVGKRSSVWVKGQTNKVSQSSLEQPIGSTHDKEPTEES